jgi:hypothetical protein
MSSRIAPTSDRLRYDIDSGLTGDKVDFPDPAAAPLGTDDEAGGHSPSARERAIAYRREARPRARERRRVRDHFPYPVIVAIAVAFLPVLVALAGALVVAVMMAHWVSWWLWGR